MRTNALIRWGGLVHRLIVDGAMALAGAGANQVIALLRATQLSVHQTWLSWRLMLQVRHAHESLSRSTQPEPQHD